MIRMMITIFSILCFFVLSHSTVNSTSIADKGKLIFAHVLFRHGDRTPISPYPNDPWNDLKYWPTGWGQLTNIGKRQHLNLGRWLRQRYINLVNETYSKDEVYVRSTDVDRTLMSALSNLAGLYPPINDDVWDENIPWQPIPVHTIPEKSDYVLAGKKPCPAYDYALNKLKKSEEFKEFDRQNKDLYDYLTKYTGMTVNSMQNIQYIYSCLHIETLYNRTLPSWTTSVYKRMGNISARSFATNTYTPQLARLKLGPLLKEILDRFVSKTVSKLNPDRSLWIYSAHDTTVANLLNTLGLFELHTPPYTACVMLELRIVGVKPFVSVFYKNTTAEPTAMYIPNCGILCPLEKMYDLYAPVLPLNWDSECQMSMLSMSYVEVDIESTFAAVVCGAFLMILIMISLIGMLYYRRRNYQNDKWYYRIDG